MYTCKSIHAPALAFMHQRFHQFCPTLDGYNGVSVDTLVKQITSCANFFFIITIAIKCLFVCLFIYFIYL